MKLAVWYLCMGYAECMNEADAARSLAELGHPIRLRTFRLLVQAGPQGLSVGDLQRHMNVPPSTFAHHLGHLVQAGLVVQRRESRMVLCSANFGQMDRLIEYLQAECCAGVHEGRRERAAEATT